MKLINLIVLSISLCSCVTLPTDVCKNYDTENMSLFQPNVEFETLLISLLENNSSFEWSKERKAYWFTDNNSNIKLCRTNINATDYCGSSYRKFEKREGDWILKGNQGIYICHSH